MNIISAYIQGLFTALSNFGMVLLLYVCNLMFGLVIAVPLHSVLKDSIGQSLEIQKIISAFDNTVFTDFMNEHGQLLSPLLEQVQWFSLLYVLLFVFLNGGVIHILTGKMGFWEGCAKYFWRFFRLTLLFLFFHLLVAGVVFGILRLIISNGFDLFGSEIPIYWSIVIGIGIYLVLASIVSALSDYAKIRIVTAERHSAIQAIMHSFGTVFGSFRKIYGLFLLNIFFIGIIYIFYWLLNSNFSTTGFFSVVFILLVQQFVMLLRMCAKVVNLASAMDLYRWIKR